MVCSLSLDPATEAYPGDSGIYETSYNAISRPGGQYCVLLSGSEMAVLAV